MTEMLPVDTHAIAETRLVHDVHRRASALLAETTGGASSPVAALADLRTFVVTALHHHHRAEDTILWPIIASAALELGEPLRDLSDDHARLDGALDTLARAPLAGDRTQPRDAAVVVRDLVHRHLDHEEPILFPALRAFVGDEAWNEFSRHMVATAPPESGPVMLALLHEVGGASGLQLVLGAVEGPPESVLHAECQQGRNVLRALRRPAPFACGERSCTVRVVLRTRFTEMFGLDYPVMSAPMALHSGATLAAAVSEARGLGSFGALNPAGPEWANEQLAAIRARTGRPFGVGFITPFIQHFEPIFDAVVAASPPVMAFSFADPRPWSDRARDAGARVMCQVQDFDDAATAVDAGADVLVVQGNEAGGHTGRLGLLPFLAAVVERYPHLPVLAAGGIADGRTMAAALTAGADGVWMGTAFLATAEAVEVDDAYKQLIIDSDGSDTVYTSAYDIAEGLPWPAGIADRVRRTRFTDEWEERVAELRARRDELELPDESDPELRPVRYGPAAAFVHDIRTAADVLRHVCVDAERILRSRPSSILGD